MIITPEAVADLTEAYQYYEDIRSGLGEDFFEEVSNVFLRIEAFPELYAVVKRDARCAMMRRFPYLVVYRLEVSESVILAVVHSSRRPGTWHSRTR